MSLTFQSAQPAPVIAPAAIARAVASAAAPVAPTPRLELSVGTAVRRYLTLASALPGTAIHYAVKANPHPVLLRALAQAGCRFDVASPTEVRAALEAGAPASHLVHSNPVARRDHLAEAHALGVRLFVVDSPGEVTKLADAAPGSSVLVRIVTSGSGSDWPLSRKYGCRVDEAIGAAQAWGSRCCEPTWNETPAGARPRWAAATSSSTASSTGQPYLRDSGQSEPEPEVTIRTSTEEPGAASASLATSPGESTTNSRTPSACASARWSRRATGLECTRWDAGAPASSAARTSVGLATSNRQPACASARSSTGCGLALTA